LGTVQLGMPYGIANRTGQPDDAAACAIVQTAWDAGVRFFDTAQAYGRSEAVLGRGLRAADAAAQACVITKLHPALSPAGPAAIRGGLEESLQRLGLRRLWGVLLHGEGQLDGWATCYRPALQPLVAEGRVLHLGASVYSPERALQALATEGIGAVQVATNLFDRRLVRNQFFTRAAAAGCTVFVRSVFLQGLVLLRPAELPPAMPFAVRALATLGSFCRQHGLAPAHLALSYALQRAGPAARIVMGVDSAAQLREDIALFQQEPVSASLLDEWDRLWPDDDPLLVDPSRWPKRT
jgi:aryl-alcohol dehydrogenase-like predicted oxidoreductase